MNLESKIHEQNIRSYVLKCAVQKYDSAEAGKLDEYKLIYRERDVNRKIIKEEELFYWLEGHEGPTLATQWQREGFERFVSEHPEITIRREAM